MAKSSKKKSTAKAPAARSAKKPTAGKAAKKKAAKKQSKKKPAKKTPTKKTPTKKKSGRAAAAKSTSKKKTSSKKTSKKTTRKKTARKAATGNKKSPAKKSSTRKSSTKKSTAAKSEAPQTAARTSAPRNGTTKKKKSSVKRPRVPYAALAAAPAPHYDPQNHQPLTNAQLRKIKSGLTAKDLRAFRQDLLVRRAEIIGDVQALEAARSGSAAEISHMPLHMADVGSDNYEQEFTLGLMESERKTVIEIDEALQRIVDKTYGVCVESGVPIGRPRLEAKPWAKYCIEVARERERRGR